MKEYKIFWNIDNEAILHISLSVREEYPGFENEIHNVEKEYRLLDGYECLYNTLLDDFECDCINNLASDIEYIANKCDKFLEMNYESEK